MSLGIEDFKAIIKAVAAENDFNVDGTDRQFSIYSDKWHSVAFQVKENSAGYLQVHQWEQTDNPDDEVGKWGRAVYSLREVSDVIQFCSIVLNSSTIYARR